MINKKILVLSLMLMLAMVLTACGGKDLTNPNSTNNDSSIVDNQEDVSTENDDADDNDDSEVEDDSKDDDADDKDDDDDADDADDKDDDDDDAEPASAPASATNLRDGKYINLDNMQFAVNGKVYTLGETTLQTLIDDGVPFDEDDIANAGNNINKNSGSQGFKIELAEYWSAQVYVLNATDENKIISECIVSEIYFPIKQDETQDILEISIPNDITEEQLIAQAGEPTDRSEYINGDYENISVEYTRGSSKYIGDCGYDIEFTNGELKYVTIDYMPE